jgi:hypothetical protein
MKSFDPYNWYWVVASEATVIYSSAVNDYVPVADSAYVAWLADGTLPTKIDTEFNLGVAIAAYYPKLRPVPVGVLDGYIDAIAVGAITDETFAVLFNHENRIRNQEGLPALGLGQMKATFKRHIRRTPAPSADIIEEEP